MSRTLTRFALSIGLAAALQTATPVPAPAQAPRDSFSHLPSTELPGRQIGWTDNDTLSAFVRAVETNRPLVVVFGEQGSTFTQKLAELVLSCPHVNQLAGRAVFAYGSPRVDDYARRMASHLRLSAYPTISVIAPRTDRLTELHRWEGLFDAETLASGLQKVLVNEGFWPRGEPLPAKLPGHVLAYPGKACTPQGADRLGITRPNATRGPSTAN